MTHVSYDTDISCPVTIIFSFSSDCQLFISHNLMTDYCKMFDIVAQLCMLKCTLNVRVIFLTLFSFYLRTFSIVWEHLHVLFLYFLAIQIIIGAYSTRYGDAFCYDIFHLSFFFLSFLSLFFFLSLLSSLSPSLSPSFLNHLMSLDWWALWCGWIIAWWCIHLLSYCTD